MMQWNISTDMLNHGSDTEHGDRRLNRFHFEILKTLIICYEQSRLWSTLFRDQRGMQNPVKHLKWSIL